MRGVPFWRGRCDRAEVQLRVAEAVAAMERVHTDIAVTGSFDLFAGLASVEEATRGQLAADLHDGVAQSLALARAVLSDAITATPEPDPGYAELVTRAAELLDDGEHQLRAVLARTRPPMLAEADLLAAVTTLTRDMAYRYGARIAVDWPTTPHRVPMAIAVTVYRFFQEALVNAAKHADGDDARLSLSIDDGTLIASVCDDGPGFAPSQVVVAEHGRQIGLAQLRERARLAGGRLSVQSTPGAGTRISLVLGPSAMAGGAVEQSAPAAQCSPVPAPRAISSDPVARTSPNRSSASAE